MKHRRPKEELVYTKRTILTFAIERAREDKDFTCLEIRKQFASDFDSRGISTTLRSLVTQRLLSIEGQRRGAHYKLAHADIAKAQAILDAPLPTPAT